MVTTGDEAALDEIAAVVNSRPLGMAYDEDGERGVLTPAGLAFGAGAAHGCGYVSPRTRNLRDFFYDKYFSIYRRVHHLPKANKKGKLIVGQPALYQSKGAFRVCHVIDCQPPYIRIRVDGTTKLVGSAALAPLRLILPDDCATSPYDVTRVGARIGVGYETEQGLQEFLGTVVAELTESHQLEVQWDPRGGQLWLNEAVDWGACRIL